jgi:ABC-type transport system involved in multi-copper enzyme maturation permease subunit
MKPVFNTEVLKGMKMDTFIALLPFVLMFGVLALIQYAFKKIKENRKSIIFPAFLIILGCFLLGAQFYGDNQPSFDNRDAIVVSLSGLVPAFIVLFIGIKLFGRSVADDKDKKEV